MGQTTSSIGPSNRRSREFGNRLSRARRSHSMPGTSGEKHLVPQNKKSKGLSAKGRNIYSVVRHKLLGNGEQSNRSVVGEKTPNLRIPAALKGKAARDHAKMFRELASGWTAQDLHCLVVEYESSLALRDLTWRADAARPHASTLREDLGKLFQNSLCTDIVLVFDGKEFPVHSAILRRRSTFFRKLFDKNKNQQKTIDVRLPTSLGEMSAETFGFLLQYLYTGEVVAGLRNEIELILKLKDQFGTPHTLDYDAYSMLQQAEVQGEATLVFVANSSCNPPPFDDEMPSCSSSNYEIFEHDPDSSNSTEETEKRTSKVNVPAPASKYCEFHCHSVILAARSPFFRTLIQKRMTETSINGNSLQIVLDENVIPRIYAPVLLHALYTDQVDLTQVIRGYPVSVNSLSEVQAIAAGKCQVSPIEEATEIYQIARFLEFDRLAQGCEDIIVQHINLDCLPSVYNWSVESYGSQFVQRHCVNFLCQEFSKISNSSLLFDLEESLLVESVRSDFVQSSELELLQCVIRWGEHQLVRRMEEREPNILNGTTHSISRKGVRRADLSDDELREIVNNLMPLVRTDYILPPYHHALVQATSRGLVSCPPADLPGSVDATMGSIRVDDSIITNDSPRPDGHWLHPHTKNKTIINRSSSRPRLFLPYYEEAKNLLSKRLVEFPEQSLQLLSHHPPALSGHFPDTLYMVNSRPTSPNSFYAFVIDSSSDDEELPLPDFDLVQTIERQATALMRSSTTVQKALACGCAYHRKAVHKQIRLRVLREFGLSDQFIRVLRHPSRYYRRPRSNQSYRNQGDTDSLQDAAERYRRYRSEPQLLGNECGSSVAMASSTTEAWPDLMCGAPEYERYTSCNSLEDDHQINTSNTLCQLSDLDLSVDSQSREANSELQSLAREIEQFTVSSRNSGHQNVDLVPPDSGCSLPPDLVDNR